MRIICSKCGHILDSVIIDKELAFREVFEQLGKHILRQHPQVHQALAIGIVKVAGALSCFMSLEECAVIPEDDTYLNEKVEEMQKLIVLAAGYEEEEEESDEEEEEENENNGEDDGVTEVEGPKLEGVAPTD